MVAFIAFFVCSLATSIFDSWKPRRAQPIDRPNGVAICYEFFFQNGATVWCFTRFAWLWMHLSGKHRCRKWNSHTYTRKKVRQKPRNRRPVPVKVRRVGLGTEQWFVERWRWHFNYSYTYAPATFVDGSLLLESFCFLFLLCVIAVRFLVGQCLVLCVGRTDESLRVMVWTFFRRKDIFVL